MLYNKTQVKLVVERLKGEMRITEVLTTMGSLRTWLTQLDLASTQFALYVLHVWYNV